MLQPLDGPSKQYKISNLTTTTTLQVKDGGSDPFIDRKVITMQPEGRIYVYFGDEGVIPNAATVQANGFIHYRNSIRTYEASASQTVWIVAANGTVDIRVAERG